MQNSTHHNPTEWEVSQLRKHEAKKSPLHFGLLYLPHHLTATVPAFHKEILEHRNDERLALAAPRGHAKSTTLNVVLLLYELCYQDFHYAIIVGGTQGQAQSQLASLKDELENNAALKQDFGNLKPDVEGKWTETAIVTTTGIKVEALGVGSKIRGRKFKQYRPDRLHFDDIEDDENVATLEQRKKLKRWFFSAAIPALDVFTGKARFIGTILHFDSLLADVTNPKNVNNWWTKLVYQAIWYDAKGEPHALWPEHADLRKLAQIKEELGPVLFAQEYLNLPLAEDEAIVKREWIKYHQSFTPEQVVDFDKIIRIDPSGKASEKSDYFAIVVVGKDAENKLYQLDAKRMKLSDPDAQVAEAFGLAEKWSAGKPEKVVLHVESNAYQNMLVAAVQRMSQKTGRYWRVEGRPTTTDKTIRLKAQSGLIAGGYVLFDPATASDLVEELVNFGATRYDDLMDAFVGCLEGIRTMTPDFLTYMKERAAKVADPNTSFINQMQHLTRNS